MCGITGFQGEPNNEKLKILLESISHRGPDDEGFYEGKNFSIGMRRLAIIDTKHGNQPIWNEDRTLAICFNGEIYNYKELWNTLVSKGHKFATNHSDTETIIHGFEEWGEDVVNRMQGMFAFVIYDLKKQRLFIARDRLGIKPLYYTYSNNSFTFSSEIKALLKISNEERTINKELLYSYLLYRTHDHTNSTFYNEIEKFPAAHYMYIDSEGKILEKKKYWTPAVNISFKSTKSDEEYASELKDKFTETVKSHLISDVPVGITLSGGLDSTGVACTIRNLLDNASSSTNTQDFLSFSAVYPNESIDESEYIKEASIAAQTKEYRVTPTLNDFWRDIDNWIYTQEEPTISSAPYAIYSVMKEAQKHVKVILSGQGGDELFAGYIPYFSSYLKSAKQNGEYLKIANEIFKGMDIYYPFFKKFLNKKSSANETMDFFINKDLFKDIDFKYTPNSNLNERLYEDLTKYSIPNVLRYEDKNAMAFSIETRVPFLDHKFVEYVLSLPIDQKIKNGWNRYIYRNAMKGIIPENIRLRRKKIGFTTPERIWMKEGSEHVMKIFKSDEFKISGIFNQDRVIQSYADWLNGKNSIDALLFWRILNTQLWINRFNLKIK